MAKPKYVYVLCKLYRCVYTWFIAWPHEAALPVLLVSPPSQPSRVFIVLPATAARGIMSATCVNTTMLHQLSAFRTALRRTSDFILFNIISNNILNSYSRVCRIKWISLSHRLLKLTYFRLFAGAILGLTFFRGAINYRLYKPVGCECCNEYCVDCNILAYIHGVPVAVSLLWCRCYDVAVMMSLLWCLCCGVHVMMSLLRCPYYDVAVMMPLLRCPCYDAPVMMPMLWCPGYGVRVMMSMLWCPCYDVPVMIPM